MNDGILATTLLDLHSKLQEKRIEILLGGGFGLFLKQTDLLSREARNTLIPANAWPLPRSTSDLDLFFPMDVIARLSDMQTVREVIDQLNFKAVEGSNFWQFAEPETEVKLDLLTGPIQESIRPLLKVDVRRIRPRGNVQLHARHTPEALDLSANVESIAVSGKLTGGQAYTAEVKIPSPFTYLMMKVTAFGDQIDNRDKDQGRHHALDVYRIVAMLTEDQYSQTARQFQTHGASPETVRVKALSKDFFITESSLGVLRMKEHAFYGQNMQIGEFMSSLQSLLSL
jgi:hypothetical protein